MAIRETAADDTFIPLSAEVIEIQVYVEQPFQARQSVGYNAEFLAAYQPNRTFYLDKSTRSRLQELGRFQDEIQPAGTYAGKLYHRLLIDLTWNSSRLEGNTYSLLETGRLLHTGQSAEGKDARETQMILNHKTAIDLLEEASDEVAFNRYTICNLHALLADNLLPDISACGRLRDLFVWAYERSCGRYSTVRQLLGEPDPFHMRYRKLMVKSVSEVVRSRLDKGQAAARIKAFSLGWVPVADQPRFIEVVETELLSLHEGNIARYRLRPLEFHDWQQCW